MDYKILISPRAREDLKVIVRFIAQDNPNAALRLGQLLLEKALSLEDLPFRGRIVPELNAPAVRELVFKSYRIIYEVSEEARLVAVLRFWHAARGTPEIA
jgi:plasmid stabilization system protein ParE